MISPIAAGQIYTDGNGAPTRALLQILQEMKDEIEANKAKLDAIAALADPSGGATVDAEARAVIAAILDAAG